MGAGLLVMASGRLSWAITVAGCLFWVYGLSTFTFSALLSAAGGKIFPVKGRPAVYTCLSAFFSSIYIFLFWLLCPFAAFETFMLLSLTALFCASSGIAELFSQGDNHPDIFDIVSDSVSQAASISGLLIAFSILREPLSYCMLSFPGTFQGMITIMYFKSGTFFPIGIFGTSAGALLLLGYIICLYQYFKGNKGK